MKVIILAGGWGTRLGQLSEIAPKPMVHIGNYPILWHIMKFYSYYGFKDFIICLGVKAEIIKSYFSQYQIFNNDFTVDLASNKVTYYRKYHKIDWKVTLIDTGLNALKGARIKRVERYIKDDVNMLTYGDGLANVDLRKLVSFHKSHGKMVTITGVRPTARFGELNEKGGKIVALAEKPKNSKMFINGGFMVFNKAMLTYLSKDESCDLEYGTLEKLAKEGEVMVYKHRGDWECMDNERDVDHLNRLWNENKAFWKVW